MGLFDDNFYDENITSFVGDLEDESLVYFTPKRIVVVQMN